MRLLALDFDGVISNSAPEAFVVSLRTDALLRPRSALAAHARELDGPGAPSEDRVLASPLYAPFVEAMPLGNRAEDFAVILRALEVARPLPDQASYDAWREQQDPAWLRLFHERFYAVRGALADADPEGWSALLPPYPELLALLRRRARDAALAIATAKDRRSVQSLLARYGVADLFPPERVLDKETGRSKTAHLAALQTRTDLPFRDITFVDDKVNHLDLAAPLGVRCALAAWGYNGARERQLARSHGYLVCQLEDVEQKLYG
ncbi:MAG TPA: HAD family hydrolase [Myxococcota bacterium]|nr:HAD family hydrolase [Myxococcota bacterium]